MSLRPAACPVTTVDGFGPDDLAELEALVNTEAVAADHPNAVRMEQGVPIYDAAQVRAAIHGPDGERAAVTIRNEWAWTLAEGPGVISITGAVAPDIVDRASEAIEAIIADEAATGTGGGDHYAKPGANIRVWNALEKLAVADPATWVDYHGNDMIDLAAAAWLGPGYQVTAQVNVINPGGEAQSPHRDYHLGFTTEEMAVQYPIHAHRLSPVLTLQGAIAHCDITAEAGSTMLLPHSQRYDKGYVVWRRPEVVELFKRRHIQLGLAKGDLLFFNPAVLHAGGHNRTSDVRRMANLLQISSAMGRATEAVDRGRIVRAVYPELSARVRDRGELDSAGRAVLVAAVASAAEGYAFPTNLDRDRPVGSLTPPTQQDLVFDALDGGVELDDLITILKDYDLRRATH